MTNNQEQNINRYLNNEMSKTERIAFEEQLRNDETMINELTFQRGFAGFLGRYQPNLENKLDNLGDEYILNAPKQKPYKWWIIFGLLLLFTIVFTIIFRNRTASNVDTNTNSNSIIEPPQEILNQLPTIEKDTIPFTPIIDKIKLKKENQKTNNQVIASIDPSLYEQNPNMELLISNTVRAKNDIQSLTIIEPANDAIFTIEGLINFRVKGTAINPLNYDILIFDNQDFNINNNDTVLKEKGTSIQEEGENKIEFSTKIPLGRGLYYFIIQSESSREILHISRFEVR